MTESTRPDDDSVLPKDPAPASDPEPTPRVKVTPLDEDKNIEDGIEVDET